MVAMAAINRYFIFIILFCLCFVFWGGPFPSWFIPYYPGTGQNPQLIGVCFFREFCGHRFPRQIDANQRRGQWGVHPITKQPDRLNVRGLTATHQAGAGNRSGGFVPGFDFRRL
jgi:hypothetical protein